MKAMRAIRPQPVAGAMNRAPRPLSVECPFCGAKRFKPCILVDPLLNVVASNRPHKARMQAADRARRFK